MKGGEKSQDKVTNLLRRTIEARIAGPLIQGFVKEFGKEKTLSVVKEVIDSLAMETGIQAARVAKGKTLKDFADVMFPIWSEDDALKMEILERSERKLSFKILRCRYAEMYKEEGIPEFGFYLSCIRDFPIAEGFNSNIRLHRPQTIMEGSSHCIFEYVIEGNE